MELSLTIGQYFKGNSWIHKLDPRFKIISVIILMIVIFMLPSLMHVLVTLFFLFLIIISAKLPFKNIINGLKPIIFLSLFSFILQVIYSTEGTVLYTLAFNISIVNIIIACLLITIYLLTNKYIMFKLLYLLIVLVSIFCCFIFIDYNNFNIYNLVIYQEGLLKGSFFVTRIITIVILSTLLTLTTSTVDLNSGLERVLKPFFFLPVAEISLMISLTLRFVPTLLQETSKILKAQASRGVDFSEGSLSQKVKQIITLLIPMFVVSFKRADDLAAAMESRGYVIGQERSSLNVLKYKLNDYIGFILLGFSLFYVIYLQVTL